MGGFNRDKYKPTPMTALKAQEQEDATKRPVGDNNKSFGKIVDGDNTLRLFPKHFTSPAKTFMEMHSVAWLPVTLPMRDDQGKIIEGKTEIKRKSIFNSKVHGVSKFDLVDEYLRILEEVIFPRDVPNQRERDAILYWLKSSQENMKTVDAYTVYASKKEGESWGPIMQYDFKKTVKTGLNALAAEYNGPDPTSPDPFTDIVDGIPIVINKTGKSLDTEYKVRFLKVRDGRNEVYVDAPLTDEQLDLFEKLPTLHSIYINSYKRKDLLFQLEGLKNVDEELVKKKFRTKDGVDFIGNVSVFLEPEFQGFIDQMLDLYPEGEDEQDQGAETGEEPPFVPDLPKAEQSAPPVRSGPRTVASPSSRPATQSTSRRAPVQSPVEPPVQEQPAAKPAVQPRTSRQVAQTQVKETPAQDTPEVAAKREQVNQATNAVDEQIKAIRANLGKKQGQA